MTLLQANKVKGLVPALDRRKVTQTITLDGQNFFADIDGPRSGFARSEMAHLFIDDPKYIQTFTTDASTASWIFVKGAILQTDMLSQRVIPVYTYVEPADQYPWSYATVGGKFYFAKRGVGLIEYDSVADTWLLVDGISYGTGVPADIVGCCESGGRLVVAAAGVDAWSVIDDGANFTPNTATGAGFQSLAIIASFTLDSVMGVYKVADGFITITKNGIMKSTISGTIIVFRHRLLSSQHIPINTYCIIQTRDDDILYLAGDGFYITRGEVPEPWQPVFSEFLRLQVLDFLTDVSEGIFKLSYITTRDWLFLSYAQNAQESTYTKAWIWAGKADEWGSFDRTHAGIAEIVTDTGPNAGYAIVHWDQVGSMFRFTFGTADAISPDLTYSDYYFRPDVEYNARTESGIAKMPSVLYTDCVDVSQLQYAGIYDLFGSLETSREPTEAELEAEDVSGTATQVIGGTSLMGSVIALGSGINNTGLLAVSHVDANLDAYVDIGAFRVIIGEAVAEFSAVTDVMIGMLDAGTNEVQFEDWLTMPDISVDWLLVDPTVYEDWGFSVTTYTRYTASIIATLDAYLAIEGQEEELSEARAEGKAAIYSCYVSGLYHLVRIETEETNDYFHLKTLELTAIPVGRAF